MLLEILDNRIGDSGILRCVADEDGGRATARLLVAPAFRHFQPPAACSGMVTDAVPVSNRLGLRGRALTALRRRISVAGLPLLGRSKPPTFQRAQAITATSPPGAAVWGPAGARSR